MNLCLCLETGPWNQVSKVAEACEAAGITAVAPADSPLLRRELYLSCAAALLSTQNTRVITSVTNPIVRHPSVTASSALSLAELAPGRIAIGIATGDSAVWGVGLKPAKLNELREYILAVKSLLCGEEASWQGHKFRGQWSSWEPPTAVPIYVACSGPKGLDMAVEVADGLILAMGYAPEDIAYVNELIDQACTRHRRDRAELDIWWYSEVTFSQERELGESGSLIWFAQWLVMGSTKGKRIPEEHEPGLRELVADSFDLTARRKGAERGRALIDRAKQLGIYDWLVSRSARLYCTRDEVRQRMGELRELGVDQWMLFPFGCDGDTFEVIDSVVASSS